MPSKRIAISKASEPNFGTLLWTFEVADELVDQYQQWSEAVQFRFQVLEDGRVEMLLQTVDRNA